MKILKFRLMNIERSLLLGICRGLQKFEKVLINHCEKTLAISKRILEELENGDSEEV